MTAAKLIVTAEIQQKKHQQKLDMRVAILCFIFAALGSAYIILSLLRVIPISDIAKQFELPKGIGGSVIAIAGFGGKKFIDALKTPSKTWEDLLKKIDEATPAEVKQFGDLLQKAY